MSEKEKEIQKHMKTLKISRAEAEQLYLDDNSDCVTDEVAEMETKAKKGKRNYTVSDKVKNRKVTKERKVDTTKAYILEILKNSLKFQDCEILEMKTETEISFKYLNDNYTVKLIKHRVKKED